MKKVSINHISVIVQIILVVITFWFSYRTLNIAEDKFASENRPYLYIDKVEWIGKGDELFKLKVINPSNFPATFFVEYQIEDSSKNKVLESVSYNQEYNLNVFPYEKEKTISFGFNKIQLTSKDTGKKIVLSKKGLEETLDLYNSGSEITLDLTIRYKGLSANLGNNFFYSQKIEIKKINNHPEIDTKKFTAN